MTDLSEHFTLEEMIESATARARNIDNTPSSTMIKTLRATCGQMEAVRKLLGKPIHVSSGYRGPELNVSVKGSKSSAHCLGYAIDFTCPDFGTPYDVCRAIVAAGSISFDQVIHEFGRWTHISFDPRYRREALSIRPGSKTYIKGIVEIG